MVKHIIQLRSPETLVLSSSVKDLERTKRIFLRISSLMYGICSLTRSFRRQPLIGKKIELMNILPMAV